MTHLYDAGTAAERIKTLHKMRRENLWRLRRLRRIPIADMTFEEQLLIHRSAFSALGTRWYEFLQTESGRAPVTQAESDAADLQMNARVTFGIASTWHMHNLKDTPYAALAPYCMNVIHDQMALEHRFEERLANGQQWLSPAERVCYNHVRPHRQRKGKNVFHMFGPGITEAVWNVYDYMARVLGEHYATTGRRVSEAEFLVIANNIRNKMNADAYQGSSVNVDRTQFDILGRNAFILSFDSMGQLTALSRAPVDQRELEEARQDPALEAMRARQNDANLATGCPMVHAKVVTIAGDSGRKNPTNYVPYLLDHTMTAMQKAIFAPDAADLDIFYVTGARDVTSIPNGQIDYRPALRARAAKRDTFES